MKRQEDRKMKLSMVSLIVLGSLGLMGLGSCSNTNQATDPSSSPSAAQSTQPSLQQSSETGAEESEPAKAPQAGGQVMEAGAYHLEFIPEKANNGVNLEFYLQKGDTHQAVSDATVTAQVQSPDGTQKTLDLTYDASGKHYTALLPTTAAGSYQVKMTSNVNGEKVDGRFSFTQ